MIRRRLDLAAAQQRLTSAIAPDEVVASARVALGSGWRRPDLPGILLSAAIAASGWAISPHPGPPSILFALPLTGHLVSLATPRRRRRDVHYLLAVARDRLLLCDYPVGLAPVRVIFASPASALWLEARRRGRLTEITCTADGQLTLFGRPRRKIVFTVSGEEQGQRVLEAFVARGGIAPSAMPVLT